LHFVCDRCFGYLDENMKKNDLVKLYKKQQQLSKLIQAYPLVSSKLWVPYCHRWDGKGSKSDRPKGCGKKMHPIGGKLYECMECEIIETRTSQQC
jgi:hypothetical protein